MTNFNQSQARIANGISTGSDNALRALREVIEQAEEQIRMIRRGGRITDPHFLVRYAGQAVAEVAAREAFINAAAASGMDERDFQEVVESPGQWWPAND